MSTESNFLIRGRYDRSFLAGIVKGLATLAAFVACAAGMVAWLGDTVAISADWALFFGFMTFFCAAQFVMLYGIRDRLLREIHDAKSNRQQNEYQL